MRHYIVSILLFISQFLFAQTNMIDSKDSVDRPSQKIILENGITKLLNKYSNINKDKEGIEGFCIQIYVGSNREKAQQTKYKFMRSFPEITSVTYERINPNWKVRVGKLRTKLEALKIQNSIKEEFPNCFISGIIVKVGEFD